MVFGKLYHKNFALTNFDFFLLLIRYGYVALDVGRNGNKQPLLILAITFSIFWLILFFMMVFMFKKIQLVIQLLKEATKAAFDMPRLILIPIVVRS